MLKLKQVKARLIVNLNLDKKWAANTSDEDILEALRSRLSYSLGFRSAEVTKFRATIERG